MMQYCFKHQEHQIKKNDALLWNVHLQRNLIKVHIVLKGRTRLLFISLVNALCNAEQSIPSILHIHNKLHNLLSLLSFYDFQVKGINSLYQSIQ